MLGRTITGLHENGVDGAGLSATDHPHVNREPNDNEYVTEVANG